MFLLPQLLRAAQQGRGQVRRILTLPLLGEKIVKAILTLALAGVSLLGVSATPAQSPQQAASTHSQRYESAGQQRQIENVLKNYEHSLNAGDVEGVVRLYTDDAVLLPPNAPSAVGGEAVRAAYTGIFQAIHLDLTFTIAEVKVMAPDWAFIRSDSTGSITILANGAQIPSSNHELFVLHKTQGRWKFARYSFSSTLPA
jgi:uncharacterized protein (TIGR02246 family)